MPPDAPVLVADWNEEYRDPVEARILLIPAGCAARQFGETYNCDTVIVTA